ncbi:nuclear transport factor 2 family protein [Acidobacteria bacterium AH-259-L09]|nr:nuclear transport factor 2 family protein [Acidobacteria bacterium AH-259-L09]
MKRLTAMLMVSIGGVVLTTVALADDVDDVKAAALDLIAAYNTADVGAIAKYTHPDYSSFRGTGLLVEAFNKEGLQAAFEAGLKFNRRVRHLQVKVYGNVAVATRYVVGTITLTDRTILSGPWRSSSVWVKQGGQWKRVHAHSSALITAQPQ